MHARWLQGRTIDDAVRRQCNDNANGKSCARAVIDTIYYNDNVHPLVGILTRIL
jgi:hypothetical protein